jgi:hypothetical protein
LSAAALGNERAMSPLLLALIIILVIGLFTRRAV